MCRACRSFTLLACPNARHPRIRAHATAHATRSAAQPQACPRKFGGSAAMCVLLRLIGGAALRWARVGRRRGRVVGGRRVRLLRPRREEQGEESVLCRALCITRAGSSVVAAAHGSLICSCRTTIVASSCASCVSTWYAAANALSPVTRPFAVSLVPHATASALHPPPRFALSSAGDRRTVGC